MQVSLPGTNARLTKDSSEEINRILGGHADVTDSPDLGPPPIAHFDEEDHSSEGTAQENTLLRTKVSGNLGSRSRRRESSFQRDNDGSWSEETPATNLDIVTGTSGLTESSIRSGAKRKLGILEDEADSVSRIPSEKSDFQFSRRKNDKPAPPTRPGEGKPTPNSLDLKGEKKNLERKMSQVQQRRQDRRSTMLTSTSSATSTAERKALEPSKASHEQHVRLSKHTNPRLEQKVSTSIHNLPQKLESQIKMIRSRSLPRLIPKINICHLDAIRARNLLSLS